jgi:hypothetical protein
MNTRTLGARLVGVVLTCLALACDSGDPASTTPTSPTTRNSPSLNTSASSDHVRWDIISVINFAPLTIEAGGVAFAMAANSLTILTIKFTGSGTFVAPASGGASGAATGGGTWETFMACRREAARTP